MNGKWLLAVIAVLLTVLSMGVACGCGSDEGKEIPPPAPNDGGFQLEGGDCSACGQEGYEPMKAGSYLTVEGTTYDLTCGMTDIEKPGLTEAAMRVTLITSTCDQATLRLNVETRLFDTKKVFVDNSQDDNYADFQGVQHKITGTGEGLSVDNTLNPTHMCGTVNSVSGPISFDFDL